MSVHWFATKGSGSNEAERLRVLLSGVPGCRELPFDRSNKKGAALALWHAIRKSPPNLLVMEGTGLAGGLVCLAARLFLRVPYIVSSGDAVGPFLKAHFPIGPLGDWYERALCGHCSGFIGWSPYLTGRAVALGARRAMTAPGWAVGGESGGVAEVDFRKVWGVKREALVIGLAGSLIWNPRHPWCYGLDLVRAMRAVHRKDVCAVIVGTGSGLELLRREAGNLLGDRVFLPGPVPLAQVVSCLQAMDAGSLPQSTDAVGASRFTTKLPEFVAARLPVVTNRIPMAYDLGLDWMWRLPGFSPWEPNYQLALNSWLESLTRQDVEEKRALVPKRLGEFDVQRQVRAVAAFVSEILEERR